jgi:hypothetical protein
MTEKLAADFNVTSFHGPSRFVKVDSHDTSVQAVLPVHLAQINPAAARCAFRMPESEEGKSGWPGSAPL